MTFQHLLLQSLHILQFPQILEVIEAFYFLIFQRKFHYFGIQKKQNHQLKPSTIFFMQYRLQTYIIQKEANFQKMRGLVNHQLGEYQNQAGFSVQYKRVIWNSQKEEIFTIDAYFLSAFYLITIYIEEMINYAQTVALFKSQQQTSSLISKKSKTKKIDCSLLKSQLQNCNLGFSKQTNLSQPNLISNRRTTQNETRQICKQAQRQKRTIEGICDKENGGSKNLKYFCQPKPKIQDYKLKNIPESRNREYIYQLYKGVKYVKQKLKPPPVQIIQKHEIELQEPTQPHEKFLFLDLDQTFVYCEKIINFSQTNKASYKVCIRPYAFTFLEKLADYYEIYVFTASAKSYAQAVVSKLNKNKPYIKGILSREHCFQVKRSFFIKDLRIVKNRQLKDIVIVDNRAESFGFQIDNGIPILGFDGYTEDDELLKLIPFLRQISTCEDVRPKIRQRFKLSQLPDLEKDEVQKLFKSKMF